MIIDNIFAQYRPAGGETADLYQVEPNTSAFGTLYISAHYGYDRLRVQLIPAGQPSDPSQYILYDTELVGNVPIYLQQIYLNQGDVIRIYSQYGDCSFVFTGEKYT